MPIRACPTREYGVHVWEPGYYRTVPRPTRICSSRLNLSERCFRRRYNKFLRKPICLKKVSCHTGWSNFVEFNPPIYSIEHKLHSHWQASRDSATSFCIAIKPRATVVERRIRWSQFRFITTKPSIYEIRGCRKFDTAGLLAPSNGPPSAKDVGDSGSRDKNYPVEICFDVLPVITFTIFHRQRSITSSSRYCSSYVSMLGNFILLQKRSDDDGQLNYCSTRIELNDRGESSRNPTYRSFTLKQMKSLSDSFIGVIKRNCRTIHESVLVLSVWKTPSCDGFSCSSWRRRIA